MSILSFHGDLATATTSLASMGIYTYYQQFNGRPSYHGGRGNLRLYFLAGSGWLIGSTLGGHTGYIHNQDQSTLCPYLAVNIQWMYVYNNLWNYDPTLVVRCADKGMWFFPMRFCAIFAINFMINLQLQNYIACITSQWKKSTTSLCQ